jgi:hypothetical protein
VALSLEQLALYKYIEGQQNVPLRATPLDNISPDSMSTRTHEGDENSKCNSRLALGREALKSLLFDVPVPNEAVYALVPNREAAAGSDGHPILELVSLLYCSVKRITYVLNLR